MCMEHEIIFKMGWNDVRPRMNNIYFEEQKWWDCAENWDMNQRWEGIVSHYTFFRVRKAIVQTENLKQKWYVSFISKSKE